MPSFDEATVDSRGRILDPIWEVVGLVRALPPRGLSVRAFLLIAICLASLGACGEEEANRFEEEGFAIAFEYPDGFEETDDVTLSEQRGSEAQDSRALGLDEDNGIIVQRYRLQRSIDAESLDIAKAEFDQLVAGLAPDAPEGEQTEIGGLPALRYSGVPVSSPADAQSRLIVLFDGSTEYLINCQSTPEKRQEIEEACDLAVDTLERAG